MRQDLKKTQGEKAQAEDSVRQLQALQESLHRQLDQATGQLQEERLRARDLEAQNFKAQITAKVRHHSV